MIKGERAAAREKGAAEALNLVCQREREAIVVVVVCVFVLSGVVERGVHSASFSWMVTPRNGEGADALKTAAYQVSGQQKGERRR